MRKIKKSLAVILAALMLASFMPLFASAAVTINRNNVKIVPPSVSPSVIEYGQTLADVTLTGGECWYVDPDTGAETLVPGHFEVRSTTTKPAVSEEYNLILKFVSDDTTQYSNISLLNKSTVTIKSGTWPAIKVNGLDATLVEAPTAAGIQSGEPLASAVLSGGKVTDADGNEISGTWSFVNNRVMDTEGTFEEEIQWKKTGYDTIKATITITVKALKATLVSPPEPRSARTSAFLFKSTSDVYFKSGSGKVIDEEGNDITANGTWAPVLNMTDTFIMKDTEIDVRWSAVGYSSVDAKMVLTVTPQYSSNLKLVKSPSFDIPVTTITYDNSKTYADYVTFNPGEITDENGNIIEGTWTYYVGNYTSHAPDELPVQIGTYALTPKFIPADTSLPELKGFAVTNNRVTGIKADFKLTEDSVLVLNYGEAYKSYYQGNALRFSTLKTDPEHAGIKKIYWSKDKFDPQTADYGSVTYVEVSVTPEWSTIYNEATVILPIKIQNFIHDGSNPWYITNSNLEVYGMNEEAYDGIKHYKVDFTNKRLKGNIDLVIGGEVVASVAPDENGKFFAEGTWTATESGEYEYYFEYKPSDEDTATVMNPVVKKSAFSIELRPFYTLTVVTKDKTYTITERVGDTAYFNWRKDTGLAIEDFTSWTFTDADGNAYTPEVVSSDDDPTTSASIYIKMPAHNVTATLGGAGSVEDGAFGSLWGFWQKLVNFIIEIYRTIVDFFVPAMEQI